MSISREALKDLDLAYQEELRKIREVEEKRSRKELFNKQFVKTPTLDKDQKGEQERLIKEQERRIQEQTKIIESSMFQDWGGSRQAAFDHFAPANDLSKGNVSQEFANKSNTMDDKNQEQEQEKMRREDAEKEKKKKELQIQKEKERTRQYHETKKEEEKQLQKENLRKQFQQQRQGQDFTRDR